MNIILSFSSIKHFQEAEGVKDSVITAQVGRILHKAFSLVDFISFVVDMWDELFHALSIGLDGLSSDFCVDSIKDIVNDVPSLFGD